MNLKPDSKLDTYIDQPFGSLRMRRVRIGRIEFEDIEIAGREAAINLQELFHTAVERTGRRRVGKDGTRYPEPLPMGAPARLLSVEVSDYLSDMVRRNLQPHTVKAAGRTLQILTMACGDIPVSRIDHKHIYTLWDLLRWAPPNLTSDDAYRGMSVESIIMLGQKARVVSPAHSTFELHRRFLTTFFTRLVKARAIAFSPMDAFGESKKDLVEDPNKPERLFSDEDLQRIFNPDIFVPWAIKFPHRWWGPILGLYTGARINEVAQLKVADILQERGVWCLAIRKTMDEDLVGSSGPKSRQRLKGKSSVRRIPIPQPVLDAGLLDFLADMQAFGHPRLFPHLSAGVNRTTGETNARYSQGLLNQFGSYLKELGFPKGVAFHAFRHTLSTELDNQGVPAEEIALITGHSVIKRVPVLQDNYYHRKPDAVRVRQANALALYRPAVELPVYRRGQFASRLSPDAKVYP
ncbi:site-specific integrase [Novilysobacter spongiicola]|uniref:Site-specific recombinase XerD n=1 Tax=Lysobacter spongiicola DSM 21749 TaxID=1122188 RepID=A0A1T4RGT4_9GAMM|nr:site-specific integrase [Lysobacter spongiicola]SKA14861.1 Site-specific recombinase XerD [Lysobacter spongiicola DSM 21749]